MEARAVVVLTAYPGRFDSAIGKTVTWWTRVGPEEFMVALERRDPLTRAVETVGAFGMNFLGPEYISEVDALNVTGIVKEIGLSWFRGENAPFLCEAWRRIECKVQSGMGTEGYRLYVGRVTGDRTVEPGTGLLRWGNEYRRVGQRMTLNPRTKAPGE